MTNRQIGALVACIMAAMGLMIYFFQKEPNSLDDYNKKAIHQILDRYEKIKNTEYTEALHDTLVEIIKARRECFSTQVTSNERNDTCRKAYINSIFQTARAAIKSAPMPGRFIRCIGECPIAGSLCSGEPGTSEEECLDMEVRCIEYCLDEYWRGGEFPDETDYTRMKSKK